MEKIMKNWTVVVKDTNEPRIELLRGELQHHGIEAIVLNKKDHNYPMLGFLELRVLAADLEKAKLLINELEER
jgi:Putative prokaryotic signal transducing protein